MRNASKRAWARRRLCRGGDARSARPGHRLDLAQLDGRAAALAVATIVEVAAAVAMQEQHRGPGRRREVLVAELQQRDDRRPQVAAHGGEAVLVAQRTLLVG